MKHKKHKKNMVSALDTYSVLGVGELNCDEIIIKNAASDECYKVMHDKIETLKKVKYF